MIDEPQVKCTTDCFNTWYLYWFYEIYAKIKTISNNTNLTKHKISKASTDRKTNLSKICL